MTRPSPLRNRFRHAASVVAAAVGMMAWMAVAAEPDADPAVALQARYTELTERLQHSLFPQPLVVESVEGRSAARGDVYAIVDHPVAVVSEALTEPVNWCDALLLHLNVKYCHPLAGGETARLAVALGKKIDQPLNRTYRVEFVYGVAASRPDYVDIALYARKGPLGTGNYRIALEAVGLENDQTFIHLEYSYTFGFIGRLAMKMYLSGGGRGKVGFSTIGDPDDPEPQFIEGSRAALERNAVRYYLAIDAYLGSLSAPVPDRFEDSLERWFSATELYPRQLYEVDRDAYFTMKRREYLRQQTLQ